MDKDIRNTLKSSYYSPDKDLQDHIWSTILKKQSISSKIKLWSYVSVGFLSLVSFVPVVRELLKQMSTSGFYEYLSLAFGGGSVAYYWKEFLLSLADSLPFTTLVMSLFLLFVLSISIKKSLEQYRNQLLIS